MGFEIALYNINSLDGKRVVNSLKAAYLYADLVRVYDFIYPDGFEEKLIENSRKYKSKNTGKRVYIDSKPYTASERIEFIDLEIVNHNYYNEIVTRSVIPEAAGSAIDDIHTQRHKKNKRYTRKQYKKDIKRLGADLIVPRINPDNLEGINKALDDFVDKCRNDQGYKLFNSSPMNLNDKTISPSMLAQPYLSRYAISKLPSFDNATVDEIIDIKDELEVYIEPFRRAIEKMAQDIEEIPDLESLQIECAKLYIDCIEPEVARINTAIQDNNVIKNIGISAKKNKLDLFDVGVIALGIAKTGDIAGSVLGGLLAPAMRSISDGIKLTRVNERKIQENNELYFLYAAGEILEN